MKSINDERFFSMAETYNQMCELLVPKYNFLQHEALEILPYANDECITVVDLGAGSGILIEKILTKYSNAQCYWVDFSGDFRFVAEKRLRRFGSKVKYILSPIEEKWEKSIESEIDAIVSMSAIHHLETQEKKQLYGKCYGLLKEGGWFINVDELKTVYDDSYIKSLYFWDNYVNEMSKSLPKEKIEYFQKWRVHFDNWKVRNIDNISKPRKKGDDIHESFLEQLIWLNDIGFSNVDIFLKYYLWGVIGGSK